MLFILRLKSLKVLGSIGLICLATQVYAEEHSHEAGEHKAAFSLNQGKKWEGDAVLRQGMEAIRQAVTANQEAIEKNRLGTQDYQRLADTVNNNIASIVNNCKLTKDVDEAFHTIVLADLSGSADMIRTSPKIQIQRAGALGMLQALRNYGTYFQHPGWRVNEVAAH